MSIRVKRTVTLKKVLALIILLILCFVMLRLVYTVYGRSEMAVERRDGALAELNDTITLAAKLEAQVARLESETGVKMALRERYGLVSENEGYLILLHEHNDVSEEDEEDWWQILE